MKEKCPTYDFRCDVCFCVMCYVHNRSDPAKGNLSKISFGSPICHKNAITCMVQNINCITLKRTEFFTALRGTSYFEVV